jgi:hypothetical protein
MSVPPYTSVFLLFRYLGNSTLAEENRKLSGQNFKKPFDYNGSLLNRHEVPYASTMEGGAGAFSKLTSKSQNKEHGDKLNSFYQRNNLQAGDYFLVPLMISGDKNPQPYSPPIGVRRPDSNPLPYLVPVGVEAGEGLEIALELLEGLILL